MLVLMIEMGSYLLFTLGWSQTVILQISTSVEVERVGRITGVNHHACLEWFFFFFLFVVLEVEFRALHLLGVLPLGHSLRPFIVGYFWDKISLYVQASLDFDPPISASPQSWDDRYVPLHPAIGWGVACSFCLDWPWIAVLPISSQVARITALRHLSRCPV
jgi:hypothetical protein